MKEEKPQDDGGARQSKWFEQIAEFDITVQASFISFTIQSLMCVGKWESLVDISNRLNMATDNTYASQLLPFIIFAQTTLYEKAAAETQEKKRSLDARIQSFENWKLTNKKKKSRQAMITGEIPQEEQEFLNDKAILEKKIFRDDVIENVLLSDRDASNKLLENIKRDANNADEALKSCRKLYFQFGVETMALRSEE
jgi:golgin subfamily B member 1